MIETINPAPLHHNEVNKQTPTRLDFNAINAHLITLKNAIFHTPLTDDNEKRLNLIKDTVSKGQYQIQSQTLATKLLEHLHLFGQREMA